MKAHEIDSAVLRMMEAAAAAGDHAPTGRELCKAFGWSSLSMPAYVLSRLERRGLIVVHRHPGGGKRREVTIVSSLRSTGPVPLPAAIAPAPAVVVPTPVDRDPCFRCGVRGDIGCVHRQRWAA